MIKTSEAFLQAIVGSPRRIELFAVVDISDPDKVMLPATASPEAAWSKPEELYNYEIAAPPRLATLEPGRWLLDGSFDVFQDSCQVPQEVGYASAALSGADGSFSTPVWVQLNFSGVRILQAFSVYFSTDPLDGVPQDFTVDILDHDQSYYRQEVTGNRETEVQFKGFTVYDPTSVRLTVTRWSLPGRRMRMVEFVIGLFERWTGNMLESFFATLQGQFSCLSLPYGTVELGLDNQDRRFEPRRKDSIFQSIEERQGVDVFIGCQTSQGMERVKIGVFYQAGDGWKTSGNDPVMRWSLVDIIGLLAERTFLPPEVLPETLEGWLQALVGQLGDAFKNRYHADPAYADLPVTASSRDAVTGKKCNAIIRWVCQASGTWPRADAATGRLTAEPLWNQGQKVTLDNLSGYPAMKANESLAALIFQLADGEGTEFVVSGNSTSSEKTVTIINPFIHTPQQALTAARLILAQYGGNIYETTGRGNPASEIGDVDTIWLDGSSAATARRMMQTFEIRDGVLQGCRSRLLQADGSYLWTEFEVLDQDEGDWTAPEGVTEFRLVLSDGGQGGGYGHDGYVHGGFSGSGPSGTAAGYGEPGQDGAGGRVWYGTIKLNPGAAVHYKRGAGGAAAKVAGVPGEMGQHSVFGVYTSEDGQLYPNGYTDIANGQAFCRPGVPSPLPGTGDGGKGGAGGEPGEGYWKAVHWTSGDVAAGRHPGATLNGRPVPAGTPGSTSIVGQPRGSEFIVTKPPGPGHPGAAGASGFIMLAWEKTAAAL